MPSYRFAWRGAFANAALNALHGQAFGHEPDAHDWRAQVQDHSLGWVCAYDGDALVGFVNVPWDGALHAFIMDTIVAPTVQRQGIGTELVRIAAAHAKTAGCVWLHVDYDEAHKTFYLDACGFTAARAGLLSLRG